MKTLSALLLVLLLVSVSSAQSSSNPAAPTDVAILQKGWRMELRDPALDIDPFRANDEHNDAVRAQKENNRLNAIRIKKGANPEPYSPPIEPVEVASDGPTATYIYSVKIRNDGLKTIRSLVWEYLFIEPDTQKEIGNHRYMSKVNIRPSKSCDLTGRSASPPNMVVDAAKAGKKLSDQLSERVVIQRIEYEDGSFWQRPPN